MIILQASFAVYNMKSQKQNKSKEKAQGHCWSHGRTLVNDLLQIEGDLCQYLQVTLQIFECPRCWELKLQCAFHTNDLNYSTSRDTVRPQGLLFRVSLLYITKRVTLLLVKYLLCAPNHTGSHTPLGEAFWCGGWSLKSNRIIPKEVFRPEEMQSKRTQRGKTK